MKNGTKHPRRNGMIAVRRRAATLVVLLIAMATGIVTWSVSAQASTIYPVTATVAVGGDPLGVAVDPTSHVAYVANANDNSLSVIDGATDTVTHTVGVGVGPFAAAVDPTRHVVYVTEPFSDTVSVVSEVSNTVTHTLGFATGTEPDAVAVDPATHTAWVANANVPTVTVIDEVSNAVTHTIATSDYAYAIAIDTTTHTVYVPDIDIGDVSVIDEASNTVTHVIPVGGGPSPVAVDPSTHTAYVVDEENNKVLVFDEASNAVTHTIPVDSGANAVAVDPGTHTAYVAVGENNEVMVIDEASNTVTQDVAVGSDPVAVAVDPATHAVYVVNAHDNTVSVISPTASQKQYQSITFTSVPPAPAMVGGSYVVTASGGGSGNPVRFADGGSYPDTCVITDNGNSSATVSFIGSGRCEIAATQAGNAGYVAAPPVRQAMTVAPGPVATLTPRDGSGQSTVVGTPFVNPLVAMVADKHDNATPGASVTFTVTAGSAHFATGSTATAVADGDGDASAPTLTAGTSPGPVTVTATSGAASGTFSETVTPATVISADLAVTLSAPAEVQTGTKLALVVTVSNAGPSLAGRPRTFVPIPAGFTITKTGGGRKYGSTIVFGLWHGLAAGASHRYTINLTTTRKMASDATFHANITSPTADPNTTNDSASDTIHVN